MKNCYALLLMMISMSGIYNANASDNLPDYNDTLSGDWGGKRSSLHASGVDFSGDYTSESVGIINGEHHGGRYAQQIRLGIGFDLNRIFSTDHAGKIQITLNDRRGRSASADLLGNRLPVQEVYGGQYSRLSEFSYSNWLFTPRFTTKIGLMAMGNDFATLSILTNFFNTGFCAHPQTISGGSGWTNYPMAHLGAEFKYSFNDSWAIQTAIFNVNPKTNMSSSKAFEPFSSGTTGMVMPLELNYRHHGKLPGEYRVGYYHDTSSSPRITSDSKASNRHGVYFLADQGVWQDSQNESRNLHVFVEWTEADRSTAEFRHWYGAGLVLNSPFSGRPKDAVAIAYGHAEMNGDSRRVAIENAISAGDQSGALQAAGADRAEQVIELSYTYQAAPWLVVRPDIQYIKGTGAFTHKQTHNALVPGIQLKATI